MLIFDNIIELEDIDFGNILIDEKSQKNILIYDISYITLIGSKPLRIRFDKTDGFIKIYDGTRYLILFGSEKYDAIYSRIRYITSLKSSHIYFSHCYAKNEVDLPIEKILTLHVIILIKSVLNKDENCYYYMTFSEKYLYQLAKIITKLFLIV